MTHATPRPKTHTISVKVSNKPGVLLRIAAIFSRRGFNIESLVVSPALDGHFSRMTITAEGDPDTLDQIIKQLSKLVDIVLASEHDPTTSVEKELALIKIKMTESEREPILQVVQHFKSKTVDFTDDTMIIQIAGDTEKLDACIDMLNTFQVIELVRTGKVLMARGQDET